MTDGEREAEIVRLGKEIERHYGLAQSDSACYFLHMGNAAYAQGQMFALIRSRPPEFVAKLEQERGLV